MFPFPDESPLGTLHMVEVYDFYDGPRLFSCASETGSLYLGYWADQDERGDAWIYVNVSP